MWKGRCRESRGRKKVRGSEREKVERLHGKRELRGRVKRGNVNGEGGKRESKGCEGVRRGNNR